MMTNLVTCLVNFTTTSWTSWPALLDLLTKITLLLAIGLVLDGLLRRRWAVSCAMMWNAMLVALVALPIAEGLLPKTVLWSPPDDRSTSVVVKESGVAPQRDMVVATAPPEVPANPQPAALPPAPIAVVAKAAPETAVPSVETAWSTITLSKLPLVLAVIYGIGLLVAIARFAAGWRAVARLRRSSSAVDDPDWQDRLANWLRLLNVRDQVVLRMSDAVNVPLVVGHRRPMIVVPSDVIAGAKLSSRDAVLVHELAHVVRRDYAWQLLLRALETILWFHPLVWLVERRIGYVRERVCDAFSVHGLGSAEQYADALLEMAGRLARRCAFSLGLAVVRSSKLGERLAAIFERGGDSRYTASRKSRFAAMAASLGLAALLGHTAVAQVSAQRQPGLPDDARAILAAHERVVREAQAQIQKNREQLIVRLQALQDQCTRAADLDAAVAIRDQIRALRENMLIGTPTTQVFFSPPPAPPAGNPTTYVTTGTIDVVGTVQYQGGSFVTAQGDPGNMSAYRDRLGEDFYFRVRGAASGYVWGSDAYSDDSTLARAAVHAGVLGVGQEAVLRVTMLKGPAAFTSSTRHGVTTSSWDNRGGTYAGCRIEPLPAGVHVRTAATAITPAGAVQGLVQLGVSMTSIIDDPGTMTEYAKRRGQPLLIRVTGTNNGTVWGSELFTSDSDLSTAALHSGIVQLGQTAVIKVTMEDGLRKFTGTTRYGVTSYDWDNSGGYYSAYRIDPVEKNALQSNGLGTEESAQPDVGFLQLEGYEFQTTRKIGTAPPISLSSLRDQVGRSFYLQVRGSTTNPEPLWGTGVYTDDSSLAAAAVHAGVLDPGETGIVKVTVLPGRDRYEGSTLNGMTSHDYGQWGGSYRVEAVPASSNGGGGGPEPIFSGRTGESSEALRPREDR
jgi:beta-lactamase regulating signal transducer with metallopeptidase domain